MQQATTVVPHPIGVYKRWHYAFLFLFGLFSCFFITAVAVWISYRSIFESGLLGFFHVCTGVLIGLYIGADVLEISRPSSLSTNTTAASETQRVSIEVARQLTLRRHHHEYEVYRRGAATMIIITLLGILLSVLYLYNLLYLLTNVCPQMHHSHASVQNVLELRVSYEHVPRGESYAKRNHLLLRYDSTGRTIVQKQRHTNPNVEAYHNWFTRNEVHSYDSVRAHASPAINATDEQQPPLFCMRRGATIFDFLQNEINQVLYRNLEARRSQSSFSMLDFSHWDTPLRATSSNEDEEDMDFHMMTRKMCRDEYGFIIGLIAFILLWDLLCIANFAYNIWLYRQAPPALEPVLLQQHKTAVL